MSTPSHAPNAQGQANGDGGPPAGPPSLEKLQAALEELRVTEEELRIQNEELQVTRAAVEAVHAMQRHYEPLATRAGLAISPRGIGTMAMMLAVRYLIDRIDHRALLVAGLVITAVSFELISCVPPDDGAGWLAGAFCYRRPGPRPPSAGSLGPRSSRPRSSRPRPRPPDSSPSARRSAPGPSPTRSPPWWRKR